MAHSQVKIMSPSSALNTAMTPSNVTVPPGSNPLILKAKKTKKVNLSFMYMTINRLYRPMI